MFAVQTQCQGTISTMLCYMWMPNVIPISTTLRNTNICNKLAAKYQ